MNFFRKKEHPLEEFPLCTSSFSTIEQPPRQFTEILSYYDRIRSYLQHEDGLLNSRLTWSLSVHAFLFAIFGILTGKIADQFTELNKHLTCPTLTENVISGLFFLQVPIAFFGALVAGMSRSAIRSAHCAIHFIFSISKSIGPLNIEPKLGYLVGEIGRGTNSFVLRSDKDMNIPDGSFLLVEPDCEEREEIIRVTKSLSGRLSASFANQHKDGAKIRALGFALLPQVIRGGDRDGSKTKGAQVYYLTLPLCAMWLWIILLAISVSLCIASFFGRPGFFRILGLPA